MRTCPVLTVAVFLVVALAVVPCTAGEMAKIAGKMEATYVKQEPMEIGDTEEHMMALGRSEGTNVSTGEHEFMDGAQIVNISFVDLVKGSGPHRGYIKFAKDGDGVYADWEGTVTTTMSAEGTPVISFEGTFTYTCGMGQYEHIQGSGTYKGYYTSETSYAVEWEGEHSIKTEE
jgi:hypothetical protein